MKVERIVVGIDGSPGAQLALEWAAGLAGTCGAEVVVVHARGLLDRLHEASGPADAELDPQWLAPLERLGVPFRRIVQDGSPIEVLLRASEDETADLIVVGSRRFGGYPEQLLGSTSTQVAQHARRPVVIVPV